MKSPEKVKYILLSESVTIIFFSFELGKPGEKGVEQCLSTLAM